MCQNFAQVKYNPYICWFYSHFLLTLQSKYVAVIIYLWHLMNLSYEIQWDFIIWPDYRCNPIKVHYFELGTDKKLWDVVSYQLQNYLNKNGVDFQFDLNSLKMYSEQLEAYFINVPLANKEELDELPFEPFFRYLKLLPDVNF